MAFYLFFICGILGGVLGGMGMGGGTVLIPLLTIFCGVEQAAAQGVNLVSFLPMSLLALSVHAQNGLLKTHSLGFIIVPAVLCSAGGSLVAAVLPAAVLKRAFGAFLVILSFFQLKAGLKAPDGRKQPDSR